MKLFSSIAFRKPIAGVLLVVFIFIHAVKAFHTHQKEDYSTQQKGVIIKAESTLCAICDFQLAKDSELPALNITNLPIVFLLKEYTTSFTFYHFLPATVITNRGPPVC